MKNKSINPSSLVESIIIGSCAIAVGLVLFPLDFDIARIAIQHAPYIMLSMLAVGLLALVTSKPKTMASCFFAAGLLAIVLRSSTNTTEPVLVAENEMVQSISALEVAQFSTANLAYEYPFGLEVIKESPADIVNIQGLTPNWVSFLADSLREIYPYQYVFEDIGLQGTGLYSRFPLGSVDSVMIAGVLHIEACVSGLGSDADLKLLAVQTLPPVNTAAFLTLRMQFAKIAERVAGYDTPAIVLGDFNSVPWSPEINEFQSSSKLIDSRRTVQSTFVNGSPQLFEVPVEHIFFSNELNCLKYRTLRTRNGYLGNGATFTTKKAKANLASI